MNSLKLFQSIATVLLLLISLMVLVMVVGPMIPERVVIGAENVKISFMPPVGWDNLSVANVGASSCWLRKQQGDSQSRMEFEISYDANPSNEGVVFRGIFVPKLLWEIPSHCNRSTDSRRVFANSLVPSAIVSSQWQEKKTSGNSKFEICYLEVFVPKVWFLIHERNLLVAPKLPPAQDKDSSKSCPYEEWRTLFIGLNIRRTSTPSL